jgi:hypothetical protein
VVESVTGAVTISCGLNYTQDFLKSFGILEYSQDKLQSELTRLKTGMALKEPILIKTFYQTSNMARVEQILNYSFKCKTFLV